MRESLGSKLHNVQRAFSVASRQASHCTTWSPCVHFAKLTCTSSHITWSCAAGMPHSANTGSVQAVPVNSSSRLTLQPRQRPADLAWGFECTCSAQAMCMQCASSAAPRKTAHHTNWSPRTHNTKMTSKHSGSAADAPGFCSVHAAQLHGTLRVGIRRVLLLPGPAHAAPGSAAGVTALAGSSCPEAAAAGSGDVAGLLPSGRRLGAFARLGLPAAAAAEGGPIASSGCPAAAAAAVGSLGCACVCRPLVDCLLTLASRHLCGLAAAAGSGEAAGLPRSAERVAALTRCGCPAAGATAPASLTSWTETAPAGAVLV